MIRRFVFITCVYIFGDSLTHKFRFAFNAFVPAKGTHIGFHFFSEGNEFLFTVGAFFHFRQARRP